MEITELIADKWIESSKNEKYYVYLSGFTYKNDDKNK
jgi:hypothetical protein